MNTSLRDLRYWLRIFRRHPALSITLVLTLALGIGGATTMFSVLYGVVLQPLPLREPDRLVVLSGASAPPTGSAVDWWSQGQTFEGMAKYRAGGVNLTEGELPVRAPGASVSAGFFSVLGISPQLGRTFTADEEQLGNNRVAIMSDRLWAQNYSRDQHVIGRTITLNGLAHTIVGVMPPGFSFPGRTDVWVPNEESGSVFMGDDDQTDLPFSLRDQLIGRLRPGITLQQAQVQLTLLFDRYKEIAQRAGRGAGDGVRVLPLHDMLVGQVRHAFWIL
ncbi:MAG: ABC transporter permease, partial [Blastocatellia bacterium]|nr:ABC transporter permease [Blastocatellia bacterium]